MGAGVAKAINLIAGSKIELRILMVGLDAAGKTTMLYKLKLGEIVTTIPTIGFNVETVAYKNINFTVWDVGSRDKMRPLWRHYYQNTQAVIWMIDSNDRERIDEVADEMNKMLREDELRDAVFLIVANKQDLPNAMSVATIAEKLHLAHIMRHHKWYIQAACATGGDGLYEALDWLSQTLSVKETKSGLQSWFGSFFSAKADPEPAPKEAEVKEEEITAARVQPTSSASAPFASKPPYAISSSSSPTPSAPVVPEKEDLPEHEHPSLIQHATDTSLTSIHALRPYLPKDVDATVYKSDSFAEYKDDADLLKDFVDCENQTEIYKKWNHLWLLRVIWIHLAAAFKDGTRRGAQVKLLIERVQNFFDKAPKTFKLPFHFTLLYFWIQLTDYCLRINDVEGHDKEVYTDLLRFWKAHPWLLNDQLFTQYYSQKVILHTPESMKEFMLPDVKPLPSIVAFKPANKT